MRYVILTLTGCALLVTHVADGSARRRRHHKAHKPHAATHLPRPERGLSAAERTRRRVLSELSNTDARRRADAAWEAGRLRLRAAYPKLRRLLRDKVAGVRRSAGTALGLLGNREAVLALYDQIIREKDPTVIAALAVALGRLKYRTARPLIAGLTWNSNPILRAAGIAGLGYLGDPEDVATLRRFLHRRDPGQRQAAVEALGHLGQPAACRLLRPLLRDPHPAVRAATIDSLAQLGSRADADTVAKLTSAAAPPVRLAAVRALRRIGTRRRHLAAVRRQLSDADEAIAAQAALTVGRLGGSLPAARLRTLLSSRNNSVRVAAARATGLAGVRAAIPDLQALITHPHRALRLAAIQALGRLVAHQARDALLARLREDTGETRAALLRALGEMRAVDATPAVAALLGDADTRVAAAAAHALAEMARLDPRPLAGLARRLEPLLRAHRPAEVLVPAADAFSLLATRRNRRGFVHLQRLTFHPETRVREMAARGLARYGDRLATPAVERLLRDPSPRVRIEAALSLVRLGLSRHRGSGARLRWPTCHGQPPLLAARCELVAARRAGRLTPAAHAALRAALLHGANTPARARLIPLLREVGGSWALPVLEEARHAPQYLVRAAARRALSIWPPRVSASRPSEPTVAPNTARKKAPPDPRYSPNGPDRPFTDEPGSGCGCGQEKGDFQWFLIVIVLSLLGYHRRRKVSAEN